MRSQAVKDRYHRDRETCCGFTDCYPKIGLVTAAADIDPAVRISGGGDVVAAEHAASLLRARHANNLLRDRFRVAMTDCALVLETIKAR